MKNQIKALDTAKDNCEDGANMIQTAEGYMAETHDILNRMTELAEKAANGVLADEDRDALQDEMNQLCAEIDRIASTANFNGHKLLDGSSGKTGALTFVDAQDKETTVTFAAGAGGMGGASANTGITLQIGDSSTNADRLKISINEMSSYALFNGMEGKTNKLNDTADGTNRATAKIIKNCNQEINANGVNKTATGVSTLTNAVSIDITTKDHASVAADLIRKVSTYVSDERGKLGAAQNRLEHTINNLTTTSENMTAANSRIRDTNMAEEMMSYTSKNVIAQAAQAMLAQANSQPQNVLSLLQ
jgi:flagellin